MLITLALASSCLSLGQSKQDKTQAEVLRLEKEFSEAVVKNDATAVGQFLADDWIIIDPDGGIIDKAAFLGVIKSGTLTHEMMESEDPRVRVYGNTAIITALTKTKGKFGGQAFTAEERATDVFVKHNGRWLCAFSQLTKFARK
jgi:ketosteroid isomerase-like protein